MYKVRKFTVPVAVIALLIITVIGTLILEDLSISQFSHMQVKDMNAAYYIAEAGIDLAYLEQLAPDLEDGQREIMKIYTFSGGGTAEVKIVDTNGDGIADLTSTGNVDEAYRVINETYFYSLPTNRIKDAVVHITNIAGVKHGTLVKDYSGLGNDGESQHVKSSDSTNKYKNVTDYWGNSVNVLLYDRSPKGSSFKDESIISIAHNETLQVGDGLKTWEEKADNGGTVSAWIRLTPPRNENQEDVYSGVILQKGQVQDLGIDNWGDVSYSLHYHELGVGSPTEPYTLRLMINGKTGAKVIGSVKKMGYEKWYHVLGTWGTNGMKLYINGELDTSNNIKEFVAYADPDITDLYVGNQHLFADSLDLEGRLMDILVINRQIQDVEVESLFLYRNIFYEFNGVGDVDSPNEGEGRAIDSTVFQYHGLLLGGVDPLGVDRFGVNEAAYSYDGKIASVTPGAANLGVDDRFTVMNWIKLIDDTVSGYVFYDAKKFSLFYNGIGGFEFDVFHNSTIKLAIDIDSITTEWLHFMATFNGTKLTVYINGKAVSTALLSGPFLSYSNRKPLFVGAVYGRGAQSCIDGLIDDFTVYSRVVTEKERQEIVFDSAVYWDFEKLPLIDYRSLYPGTALGASVESGGITGSSVNFDGNDSIVNANNSSVTSGNPFSINCWVNTTNSGELAPIFTLDDGADIAYVLGLDDIGQPTVITTDSVTIGRITGTGANVIDGNWHMLTAIFTVGSIELYIDGVLSYPNPAALPPEVTVAPVGDSAGLSWSFGHYADGGNSKYFTGNIDETSIFRRALTSSEINALFNWVQP